MPRIRAHWQPPTTRGERDDDIGFAIALARRAGMFVAEPRRRGEPYAVRQGGAAVFTADNIPAIVRFLRAELQAMGEHA